MTNEYAIEILGQRKCCRECVADCTCDECREAFDMAIKALEREPKTGHWIVQLSNEEQGERPFIWWKCSECGQVIYSETEKDRREYHAYCGRCGATMSEIPTD